MSALRALRELTEQARQARLDAAESFLVDALDPNALALMRRIKAQFDPDGILNPGKLLPP